MKTHSEQEQKLLDRLESEVLALWIECGDTGHGKAQRIAYDRVLRILQGQHPGINYNVLAQMEKEI
jgi:hypothetical protein